jgi:hypothetical protein
MGEGSAGGGRRDAAIARLSAEICALFPHTSPSGARIAIGPPRAFYESVWDEFQGYARPLWAMAALARSGEAERLGGDVWSRWRTGLVAGTDPDHPDYWGPCEDLCQGFCEMPAVAMALVWARGEMWDPLSRSERQRVVDWLDQINQRRVHPNNWLMFRLLVNLALDALAEVGSRARVAEDLDALDAMYRGNGWYFDGCDPGTRSADLYLPAAFHCYGPIAAEMLAHNHPDRARELLARTVAFATNFQHFTAADGAPILWGRSLSYREVWNACWATLALVDCEALPWPVVAGLWRRQQSWWDARPVRRDDGCLALGCTYPNENVAEMYIAATSPYWCLKSFLALGQPAGHPFWSAEAAPGAARSGPLPFPELGGLLSGTSDEPLLLMAGQYGPAWMERADSRYGRFAYGTRHGFELLGCDGMPPVDLALCLRSTDGTTWVGRDRPLSARVAGQFARIEWRPAPWAHVETKLTPRGVGYEARHVLTLGREAEVVEGGFPCPRGACEISHPRIVLTGGGLTSRMEAQDGRRASVLESPAGSNLLHRCTAVPIFSAILPTGRHVLVTIVIPG